MTVDDGPRSKIISDRIVLSHVIVAESDATQSTRRRSILLISACSYMILDDTK